MDCEQKEEMCALIMCVERWKKQIARFDLNCIFNLPHERNADVVLLDFSTHSQGHSFLLFVTTLFFVLVQKLHNVPV
jgi:hypothetical protein